MTRSQKAFPFVLAVLPIAFLAVIETALRVGGYGEDLGLFTMEQVGAKNYLVMNPDVKNRYFTHVDFSPNTSQDYFLLPKPPNTFRVFFLGGSTTVGFPYGYVGSFSTFFRQRLQALVPSVRIETVNLGMTATNSYTVVDILPEVLQCQPDLIVVYDGHNEFYGALGTSSAEGVGSYRWLNRLYLHTIHLKLFQLVRNTVRSASSILGRNSPADRGTMMERMAQGKFVPIHNEQYERCMRNFRDNLIEIHLMCTEKGIPLILSTQASNLRDFEPFENHSSDFVSGLKVLSEADSLLAKELFIRAKDEDELRFRTSSDFNSVIRSMATRSNVYIADVESVFAASSPFAITGREMILEHLHPTLRGHFIAAREFVRIVSDHNLVRTSDGVSLAQPANDDSLWAARVLTSLDEYAAQRRLNKLTLQWPFKPSQIIPYSPPEDRTLAQIVEALTEAKITWEEAHVRAGEYYETSRNFESAAKEYGALADQFPSNATALLKLANALARNRQLGEASKAARRSLEVEESAIGYSLLAKIEAQLGRFPQARSAFEKAYASAQTNDERTTFGLDLAAFYAKSNEGERAESILREILSRNPYVPRARALLSDLQSKRTPR